MRDGVKFGSTLEGVMFRLLCVRTKLFGIALYSIAMTGSAPAPIILNAGGNGNEPNVSEELTADGSKEALHDPNNKTKSEFWLGFVVSLLIGVFLLGGEYWLSIDHYNIFFAIVACGFPAMIIFSFIIGHKEFALGALFPLALIVLGGVVIVFAYLAGMITL